MMIGRKWDYFEILKTFNHSGTIDKASSEMRFSIILSRLSPWHILQTAFSPGGLNVHVIKETVLCWKIWFAWWGCWEPKMSKNYFAAERTHVASSIRDSYYLATVYLSRMTHICCKNCNHCVQCRFEYVWVRLHQQLTLNTIAVLWWPY
jgi:hypothetical protein